MPDGFGSVSLRAVSRRLFQIAAAAILILAALTPLMECFDHWDKSPGPGNDTEIHATALFVGVGIVLTLAKLLRYVPRLVRVGEGRRSTPSLAWAILTQATESLEPTGSPPLMPLRI